MHVSYPDFFDWRGRNRVFEDIASHYDDDFVLTGIDHAVHLKGEVVSSNFFSVLGVNPVLGRGFLSSEEKPGSRVVVLSHEIWQSIFGADRNILNRGITLDGQLYRVIGVMPSGFAFPAQAKTSKLWITFARDSEVAPGSETPETGARDFHLLSVVARLKPGVAVEQARQEMNVIAAALAKEYPDTNARFAAVNLLPELDRMVEKARWGLLLLLAAVACVLLIACANVANLLLARASSRSREMAIRTALGAGRGRVVRQLFTESLVLAFGGAALGLPLAMWTTRMLAALHLGGIARIENAAIDGYVLAFAAVVAVLTSLIFGLVPALRSVPDITQSLKEGGRSTSDSSHRRLRSALVIAETAIGLVLLVTAGLLLQTFRRVSQVDLGFNAESMLTLKFDPPDAKYSDPLKVHLYDQLLPRLRSLPGVTAVAGVSPLPLDTSGIFITFQIEGEPSSKNEHAAQMRVVSPGYFSALGITLERGRDFSPRDTLSSSGAIIVNRAFAEKYFSKKDPVGKHVSPGIGDHPIMREVVGVVGNAKQQHLDSDFSPEFYVPYGQVPAGMTLCIRTASLDPLALVAGVRREVADIDPDLALYDIQLFKDYVAAAAGQQRFHAFLFGAFAFVAMLLTAIGLYGVMAYSVAQRTHEIGVRMTLGAAAGDVMGMVLKSAFSLTGTGLAVGILAALIFTRWLKTMLFGVQPLDLSIFASVTALLLTVSLLASYIPARRATKVDPMVALRNQ